MSRADSSSPYACQYPLFTTLTEQEDTDSLIACFVQMLAKIVPEGKYSLYLRAAYSTDNRLELFAGEDRFRPLLEEPAGEASFNAAHTCGLRLQHIPLLRKSTHIGTLFIESRELSADEQELITFVARVFSNHYCLLTTSVLDGLTGLYNRQAFDRMMNKLIGECAAPKRRADDRDTCCYFALIDVDHFKRVNDDFGHLYGDEVLLHLAQLMNASFRGEDLLFRYGGEEFAVALYVSEPRVAQRILERFRRRVEDYRFPQVGSVTVTIGYARVDPNELLSTLTDKADKALYYGKAHGRNSVHLYDALVAQGQLPKVEITDNVELF